MCGYKNCRSAKTAEEYLLKCLFAAEEERDKALAYCEEVKAAEEERIEQAKIKEEEFQKKLENAPVFAVKDTETIRFKVEPSYTFIKPYYKLNDAEILSDILAKNDKDLYEWAIQSYEPSPRSYYGDLRPIELKEKTYDYVLNYMENEDSKKIFVSEEWFPYDFIDLQEEYFHVDDVYPVGMKEEVKKEAIKMLRKNLQEAINKLKSE